MRSTWNSLLKRPNVLDLGPWGCKIGAAMLKGLSVTIARCIVICFCLVGLSGCVQSQVGIHFDSPYRGELIQRIHLGNGSGGKNQQQWLQGWIQQAQKLQGHAQRVNAGQDWMIRIPFSTADNLEERFNQFFAYLNPSMPPGSLPPLANSVPDRSPALGLPAIASHLDIQQNNFLLVLRTHLSFDIDLQSLGVATGSGEVLATPNGLVDLTFDLETPGGLRGVSQTPDALAPAQSTPHSLTWQLQPGRSNHLEANFWMINPLGMGTVVIIALVVFGLYWQQRQVGTAQPLSSPLSS